MTTNGTRFYNSLTNREKEIIMLIAEGIANKEIAAEVHITEQVVKNYLRSIYDKSGQSTRCELVVWLIRNRVVPCPCGAIAEEAV